MMNHPAPALSPLELADRQLRDWEILLDKLKAGNAPASQLDYCRAKIRQLMSEVALLRPSE